VWVQTRALGLGDWEETIDGVGVVRGRFDGRFTLAWEAPSLATAPLSATNEINAPESLADEIDGIAAEAVRSASFANDVEVVKAAVGAGATYSGVASSYDVMVVFEDSDDRNQLLIAGEPLPEERNAATWGPFDDPDTPGLSSTDIFSTATPAVIDGQVVYWPPQADLRGDARGEFRGLVESLAAGEPTVAVTASGAWANACPDDRQFDDGAVELAAADVVTAHQVGGSYASSWTLPRGSFHVMGWCSTCCSVRPSASKPSCNGTRQLKPSWFRTRSPSRPYLLAKKQSCSTASCAALLASPKLLGV